MATTPAIPDRIETPFTKMVNVRYPIVCAPMFLVSTPELVAAVSNAGGLGSIPMMNLCNPMDYSDLATFHKGMDRIFALTDKPFGVNITFKLQSNWEENFRYCLKKGVRVFLTSLGNPKQVCEEAHREGAKVFCDVTNLHHALRAQDAGVDGVIAVASGAGGHAGPLDMMALIPLLTEALRIPVLAAGAVMDGRGLGAILSLGAIAGYMGSRFVACHESGASEAYKQLTVDSQLDDTEMSAEISGIPCRYFRACLEKYRTRPGEFIPWVDIWSIGQGVGLIRQRESAAEIIQKTIAGYVERLNDLRNTAGLI